LYTKKTLPNVMPRRLGNDPSQPPENTSAKAFNREEAATSKPGVSQLTFPRLNSQTSQRTTSPIRQVSSTSRPKSVFGSVQTAPSSVSSTPPNDQ
jgi:hypothetical protein